MNKLIDLLKSLFSKEEPKYAYCLSHRTWLSRQVQEVVLEQERRDNLRAIGTDFVKKGNWYDKYK